MKKLVPWVALHVIFFGIVIAGWYHMDHLSQVQSLNYAANQVHEAMVDIETAQRGYLLDHDESYLDDYAFNRKLLVARLEYLCSLIPKTKENASICIQLGKLVTMKIDEMQSTVDAEKEGHHTQALMIFKSNKGLDYRNEIDKLVNAIKVEPQTKQVPGCLAVE